MYDYKEKIRDFILTNFLPAYPEMANLKMTSTQFLGFIFNTFPLDCISDYDLNDIMESLGYTRFTYTVSTPIAQSEKDKKENKPVEYSHELHSGWCLVSVSLRQKLTN